MPKYLSLKINEPCHENWDAMSQQAQGKFCGSCQKTVIDFTTMTDTQLVNFFKQNTGNTCGRFYDDQLDKQIAIPRKQIPWLKYFFTITLPAFLFALKATAQKKHLIGKPKVQVTAIKKDSTANDSLINNAEKQKEYKGEFWNYKGDTTENKIENLKEVVVTNYTTMGSLRRVYTSGLVQTIMCKTKGKSISSKDLVAQNKKSILPNSFTLFPNPTTANSIINLSFSEDIIGETFVEIYSASGNLLQRELQKFSTKTKIVSLKINNLPGGFYICTITNSKTNEKMSNEFLVR